MSNITVSEILIYPIKSTAGLARETQEVHLAGLANDRRWALIDADDHVVTAREYPPLLDIQTNVVDNTLHINLPHARAFAVPIQSAVHNQLDIKIFGKPARGHQLSPEADRLLSAYMGTACRLIYMGAGCDRYMNPVHGGKPTDSMSYADTAPILLTTTESLTALNALLPRAVGMNQFRPNIVVTGCRADQEDEWKCIKIGRILFDVSETCKRCFLATIDPVTKQQPKDQEPLRSLALYKKHPRGGVRFGINLIPRNTGLINTGDAVEIVA